MSFIITTSNSAPTIHDVMARIRVLRINFIAIDFDQTFIERKVGHAFTGSKDDVPLVRPIFIELINAALQPPPPPPDPTTNATTTNNDVIYVAIVTYNQRTHLIRSLLNIVFGNMASKIIIRGNDKSWKYEGTAMGNGKKDHMASAVEEILRNHLASHHGTTSTATTGSPDSNDHDNVTASPATTATTTTTTSSSPLDITKSTSLLIDDSYGIICTARENGTRAVWYNPDPKLNPKQLYIDLVQLE